ncbi:MAG: TonB-dependent receptor plug domain-containing protein [Planctomycetota bacterium]
MGIVMREIVTVFACLVIPGMALGADLGVGTDVSFLDDSQWVEQVSRRRQLLAEAPQAVTVIDFGQEATLPPWTVPDRLRYEAGIDVYQVRHGQFDVGLRGWNELGGMRTLVVVDGREISTQSLGVVPWLSHLFLSDISRIEVVKGPSSVTWGANAFGGVIGVRGRRAADVQEMHGWFDIGTDGLLDVDATALGPIHLSGDKRMSYKIAVGGMTRDDLPGERGLAPDGSNHLGSQSGDDDHDAIRARARLGLEWGEDWELAGSLAWYDLSTWELVEDLTIGSNDTSYEEWIAGTHLRFPGGSLDWLHGESDQDYRNQKSTFVPPLANVELYRYTQVGLDNVGDTVRGQVQHELGKHFISLGSEWKRWESTSNFWDIDARYEDRTTWASVDYHNWGVFAEDQWQPTPRWTLSTGLRYDDHSVVGDNLSPRLAANYRYTETDFVRAAYSSGYRLPNAFELFIDEYFFTTDEDIEAEHIDSVDIGWRRELGGSRDHIVLGAFFSRATDVIDFEPLDEAGMQANYLDWLQNHAGQNDFTVPPGPFFQNTNIDNPITIYGIEASIHDSIADDRGRIWLTTTWQQFEREHPLRYQSDGFISNPETGERLFAFDFELDEEANAPPEWKATLGMEWNWHGWFGSSVLRYVDEQVFFAFPASNFKNGTRLGTSKRDDYLALDLALGYRWDASGYRRFVRLSALDVFDSAHMEGTEVDDDVLALENEHQRASRIGRQLALVAAFEF